MAKEKKQSKAKEEKQKTYKVTYNPGFSASQKYILNLKKNAIRTINGREEVIRVSMFDSLPSQIIIEKDEVKELTEQQYKDLRSINKIETPTEREARLRKADDVPKQSGIDPDYIQPSKYASFYRDVLVLVEE